MHFIYIKGRAEPTEDLICIAGLGHKAVGDISAKFIFERLKRYTTSRERRHTKKRLSRYMKTSISGTFLVFEMVVNEFGVRMPSTRVN
jgi:hypothetical protein